MLWVLWCEYVWCNEVFFELSMCDVLIYSGWRSRICLELFRIAFRRIWIKMLIFFCLMFLFCGECWWLSICVLSLGVKWDICLLVCFMILCGVVWRMRIRIRVNRRDECVRLWNKSLSFVFFLEYCLSVLLSLVLMC